MPRAKTVDEYIAAHPEWQALLTKLRGILVATGLEESIKWGGPCYGRGTKNLVGFRGFKEHCALWFFQGVHLSDPDRVLVNAQEGVTHAMRQMRFTAAKDVVVRRIQAYVKEAIANQEAGVETLPKRGKSVQVPPELEASLRRHRRAGTAFRALTPGRQREYCEHIATAKREATKAARIAKVLPMIEQGIGLHDKYRDC